MIKRYKLGVALCTMLVTSLLFVLPVASAVTIKVLTGYAKGPMKDLPLIADEFMEKHPDVRVELEIHGSTGFHELMKTEFLSEDPVQIISVWKTYWNEYQAVGLIRDLTDLYTDAGWLDNYFSEGAIAWVKPFRSPLQEQEGFYGIADYLYTSVWFYNTEMFEKYGLLPPLTWKELLDLCEKLKEQGEHPIIMAGSTENHIDIIGKIQVQTAGLDPILEAVTGKGSWKDERIKKGFYAYGELMKRVESMFAAIGHKEAMPMFAQGQGAMFPFHTGFIAGIETAAPEGFRFNVFGRPVLAVGKPVTPFSATFGTIWAVPAKAKHVEEAYEFLKYMFSIEAQKRHVKMVTHISTIPKVNTVITNPIMRRIINYQVPYLNLDSLYLIDLVPSLVEAELTQRGIDVLLGRISIDKMIEEVQKAQDKALAMK